jgi:putative oxidoreductase
MKGKTSKITKTGKNRTGKNKAVKEKSKALNIVLWIAQVLLAVPFILTGLMKATFPVGQIIPFIPWVMDFPLWFVRVVGVCELTAGLGLLIPSIVRIRPVRTPLAASGLVILMLCAIVYHIKHSEYRNIVVNAILALVAAFVAWGRFKKVPIEGK